MSTIFPTFPLLLLSPWRRRMRLTSTSLFVLPSSASQVLLTDDPEVGAVVLLVAKLVAVLIVAIYVAKVHLHRLHGDAASCDTSRLVGVGTGAVVGIHIRHHPPNVCKVAIFSLEVGLVDYVVLWWKACPRTGDRRDPPRGWRNSGGRGTGPSCREYHRDLRPIVSSPFPFLGVPRS